MKVGFRNILVAIDFDDRGDQLIGMAADLAARYEAQLWILHIAAPDPHFVGYQVGPQYIRDIRAEDLKDEHRFLSKKAADLRAQGLKAESLLI